MKEKANPLEATIAALYVGGLAGDYAAKKLGMRAMVASDIREHLGELRARSARRTTTLQMISTTEQYISTGEWTCRDESETFSVGKQLGSQLRGGEILLLDGPLGAGKTIFVKGLAAGLDVDADEVTSPSFTLVNPYRGRLPFFHIDLYRLDAGADRCARGRSRRNYSVTKARSL